MYYDQLFYEAVRELRKMENIGQAEYEERAKAILRSLGQEPIPEDVEVVSRILKDLINR